MERAGLGLAMLLAAGCAGGTEEDTIVVGAVNAVTGDYAASTVLEAIQAAIEEINRAGGVLDQPLELAFADDRSDPEHSPVAARELVDLGVPAIIGTTTSAGVLNMTEVTVPAQVVQISGEATSPMISTWDDDGFLFRTIPSDALQGKLLAQRAVARGHQAAAVIYVAGAYGEGIRDTFTAEFEVGGGTVLASIEYTEEQNSYDDVLSDALAGEPDVVLLVAYTVDGAQIVKDYNTGFIDRSVAWLFPDSLVDPDFQTLVGASGLSFEHEGSAPSGVGPHYDVFRALDPDAPFPTYHTNNFDAAFLLALAIEQAGSATGPAIRDALPLVSSGGIPYGPGEFAEAVAAIRAGEDIDYVGASGEVDLDENGDVSAPYTIWRYDSDTFVVVEDSALPE